jgi:hypothetical protein
MDVLVQNLSKESQDMVFRAIREQLLPFARKQYPHLSDAFDKQPYPRPGNLFIVRYSAASGRPGGRGLKMHKDETALTFNLCLSPQDAFEGGGTYFPAASADVDGLLLRPMLDELRPQKPHIRIRLVPVIQKPLRPLHRLVFRVKRVTRRMRPDEPLAALHQIK